MDTTTRLATLLSGTISSGSADLDEETTAAVLSEAEKFADGFLREQASARDQSGCRLVDGRVRTPDGVKAAWQAYSDGEWAVGRNHLYFGATGGLGRWLDSHPGRRIG